jgi:hypothetical protein
MFKEILLNESQKPEKIIKMGREIQNQIERLLAKVPEGGFNDPDQEKMYWNIINDLYKKLEKVVNK